MMISAPVMTWPALGWAAGPTVAWLDFTELPCLRDLLEIVLRCSGD
jgi:hypothetical protein